MFQREGEGQVGCRRVDEEGSGGSVRGLRECIFGKKWPCRGIPFTAGRLQLTRCECAGGQDLCVADLGSQGPSQTLI
jgi:hypothetical protein